MYLIPRATLVSSPPEIGRPVVSSLSDREAGGRPGPEERGEESKPPDLQSSATSDGSDIASTPLPETNFIPGGAVEGSGFPLRKESRPASGDDEEEEDEEEVEERAMALPR